MDITSLRERESGGVFSVSDLNRYIKNIFESNRNLSAVTVKGEISNFTNHRSGHMYFSLKDGEGQIKAVMFRSRSSSLKFMPESGMKVIVHGSVSVFERDGTYQIYVSTMQPDGIGALYLAYEQLKQRLYGEGLFNPSFKRPLPKYPRRIGVITSPTGAAVRDIINVLKRRYPLAAVYVFPALVQGDGAEEDLVRGVDYFDRSGLCDVVIIGRGGGSIEDLWAFNSEKLARRIFDAKVPIISAVGHETDFTICDFVADMRAPTPSAAAELSVPDYSEITMRLMSNEERLSLSLKRTAASARDRLSYIESRVSADAFLGMLASYGEKVEDLRCDASEAMGSILRDMKNKLAVAAGKANSMNPLSVVMRGYSLAENKNGVVRSIKDTKFGDRVSVTLSDGVLETEVVSLKEVMINERNKI